MDANREVTAPVLLREHLPGLEPERRVSDWGRSELVEGVVDRTVYDFLYHYWFRVEVEGIDNVPGEGPVLLVANRAGALPTDAVMIAKAIRDQHPRPRPVHFASERSLGSIPGLDMMLVKIGVVGAHPANLHRLLFDERQVVLAFPERGLTNPLGRRYRLRGFDRVQALGLALSATATIVPVAVLGAEEATPVLGSLPGPRLPGIRRRRLGAVLPLPAKMRIRFLEPVDPEWVRGARGDADEIVRTLGAELRMLIQDNVLEMLAERRSVWLG